MNDCEYFTVLGTVTISYKIAQKSSGVSTTPKTSNDVRA